jgi:hypothetical protein
VFRRVSTPVGAPALRPAPRHAATLRDGDGADDQATIHPAAATAQPSFDGLPSFGAAPFTLTPVNHATGSICRWSAKLKYRSAPITM